MSFLQRFRRQDEPQVQTCPRCTLPAPNDVEECPECGWDMREAYHSVTPTPETDRA